MWDNAVVKATKEADTSVLAVDKNDNILGEQIIIFKIILLCILRAIFRLSDGLRDPPRLPTTTSPPVWLPEALPLGPPRTVLSGLVLHRNAEQ